MPRGVSTRVHDSEKCEKREGYERPCLGDPANYINLFHSACHRVKACCPRWAAGW